MSTLRLICWGLVLLLAGAAGGVWYGKTRAATHTVETKVVDRIVTRTVTKIRIVRPDGTVEEKEVVADTASDHTSATAVKEVVPAVALASWSLGVTYRPDLTVPSSPYAPNRWGVDVGRRILGPVWVTAGYTFQRDFLLGIRVEF
jgi:hypothetical protein